MNVYGVDPGSSITGIAHFRSGELIRTAALRAPRKLAPLDRCTWMGAAVAEFIDDSPTPTIVYVETPGKQVGKNRGAGMITLGAAVGAILSSLASLEVEVRPIEVRKWSRFPGSSHCLSKDDRATIIRRMFGGLKTMDECDAVGLAAWGEGLLA